MNEVTSSPAPVLVRTAPVPQATPTAEPMAPAAVQPVLQSRKKPAKVNRSGMILNAACILLGIVATVLFAFMLIE
jgi:hypothetical protein